MELLTLTQLLTGILTAGLVEVAKTVKNIPLDETRKGQIRIAAGLLTFVVLILNRIVDGSIADVTFIGTIADSIVSYFVAYLTYKSAIKK